jgi:PAS domain S-box-containing protein
MTENQKMLKNITLLYAEDSNLMRMKTLKMIQSFFKEIIVAKDGQESLELYLEHQDKIDVIVSDIVMPNMTGLEMIAKVREIDKDIPCLLTSSVIEPKAFQEAIDLNVTHYAIKPFDYEKLLTQLVTASKLVVKDRSLKQKESEKEHFLESINAVAIISKTDDQGIITYANDVFCEISGYTREELIGQPQSIVRHPGVDPKIYENLWKTIQTGKTWQGILKNRTKDNTPYYVKAFIFPTYTNEMDFKEYIGIRLVVTEEEEERRETNKGFIKNITSQKMLLSSLQKENNLLRQKWNEISAQAENIIYLQDRLEREQQKHKSTKIQLQATENRLKVLQEKYDIFVRRLKRA